MLSNRTAKGFTLIEVLVAGVILVATIATASLIYRSAMMSSEKASHVTAMNMALPHLLTEVKDNILQGSQSDSGQLLGVSYTWQAELIEQAAPPDTFDPEGGFVITHEPRFKLWLITMNLNVRGFSREYQYREVSW